MIRSKILGQERFAHASILPSIGVNADLGNFSIGTNETISPLFEEVLIPPKFLWIRAKIHIEPCPDIPVISASNSFVWSGHGRFASVKLNGTQILHAQKDYEVDASWTLSPTQKIYEHRFAVASAIYAADKGMHLWPCGGYTDSILEAEQLFVQVGSDAPQMFINSASAWKKYLKDCDDVIFEPEKYLYSALLSSIEAGKFTALVEQNGTQFCFLSCRVDTSENPDFINILCERNTQ